MFVKICAIIAVAPYIWRMQHKITVYTEKLNAYNL